MLHFTPSLNVTRVTQVATSIHSVSSVTLRLPGQPGNIICPTTSPALGFFVTPHLFNPELLEVDECTDYTDRSVGSPRSTSPGA